MLGRRVFRFTSWLVAIMGILAIIFFVLAIPFDDGATSEMFLNFMAAMICSGFPVAIVMAISGLSLRNMDKQKREYVSNFVNEDQRLDKIMGKLSDDEKTYIESLIASKRMGIADDGELTSLDDLFADDDSDDDQSRMNLTQ